MVLTERLGWCLRQVSELHGVLTQLMSFVPDSPIAARSWIWGRAAEHSGAVAKRVQDFLRELTATGQWVWDEMAVLRHFLQIPISSEKRQARDLVLNEIRSHKTKDVRKRLLGEIRKDDGAHQRGRLSIVQGPGGSDGLLGSGGSSRGSASSRADSLHSPTPAYSTAAAAAADFDEATEAATTATAGTPASPRFFSPRSPHEGEGGGFLRGIADTLDSARSRLLLTTDYLRLLLTTHYSLLTTLLTTDYLLLATYYSLLTAHCSLLITHRHARTSARATARRGRTRPSRAPGQVEHLVNRHGPRGHL